MHQKDFKMSKKITKKEVVELLTSIESGQITLTPSKDPSTVYAGNVHYRASNGWEITVFNDANEWDYIDLIRSSDGRELNFDDIDRMQNIRDYSPSKQIASIRYKIPCC